MPLLSVYDLSVKFRSGRDLVEVMLKREQLGLDAPAWLQYARWLSMLAHGQLGYSLTSHEPVAALKSERLAPTLLLLGATIAVELLCSDPRRHVVGYPRPQSA